MDLNLIKENIVTHVYRITNESKVPLHKHADKDEVFYCIQGSGFGVTDTEEIELTVGKAFIAQAGTLHSLKCDEEMVVVAILTPTI